MLSATLLVLHVFNVVHSSPYSLLEESSCEVPVRIAEGYVCGRVRRGEDDTKYASFRGIPYGQPPLGERRFKELEDPEPWEGYLDASEDSAACPQKELIYGRLTRQLKGQSEDCMYLNLHVPYDRLPKEQVPASAGLPILVMIHGGGFQVGSGLTDLHGPEYLITQDIVVITFNYRINVFGFLSLGTAKIPGNQGLRDVIKALKWVQKNARSFGGDPNNVTIMGQSVGATIVHIMSLSEAAEGLFHKIFMMSGTAIPNYFTTTPTFSKKIADDFLSYMGINTTDPDLIHEKLVNAPIEDIILANSLIQYDYGLTSFVPVVENEFPNITRVLKADPLTLIAEGRGAKYPLLLGYTNNEMVFFKWVAYIWQMHKRVEKMPTLTLPLRISQSLNDVTDLTDMMINRYFKDGFTLDNFIKCYSDLFFNFPTLKLAEWRALGGAPGYLYKYSYESMKSVMRQALWTPYKGAMHVEDLTMIFRANSMEGDHVSFPPTSDHDLMKLCLVSMVGNFTKCGTPTCSEDESGWPPLTSGEIKYQHISVPMVYNVKSLQDEDIEMIKFYDDLDEEIRQVKDKIKMNI